MSAKARLSSEERRDQILAAALELFARDGLYGVTTKAIAGAAGVSEALIFRHFPSKEELFDAVLTSCVISDARVLGPSLEVEPGAGALVAMVYVITHEILWGNGTPHQASIRRLLLKSIAFDGEFARAFFAKNVEPRLPLVEECLRAAHAAGDLAEPPDDGATRAWFAHHCIALTSFMRLHEPPLARYGLKDRELFLSLVRFVLRGMGLTPAAIRRELKPERLDRELERLGMQPLARPRPKLTNPRRSS